MTTVLKLGGSVVTEKDRAETLDGPALERAADAIAGRADLVVVHGGGSFGHHHAQSHGVSTTDGTGDPAAVDDIHGAMVTLNKFVVSRLRERDVPAVPVHPLSVADRDETGALTLPSGAPARLLAEGFVPVTHGDVIAHAGEGVTVLSGDEIVVSLARSLEADRVGLCSAVPGVLDDDGEVVSEIRSFDSVADVLGGSASTDVSGGMAGKVRTLLDLETEASVFDLSSLAAFLDGETPGTTIHSE